MNFWRRNLEAEPERTRADVIIQKKRRRQDPKAKGLAAVAIPRVGSRKIHQRNEDRHVLDGTIATAILDKKKHQVEVLNLSSNGLMIRFDGQVAIGQTLRIAIEECAPVTAEVRWIQNDRIGLEFAAETVIIAEAGVQDFIIETICRERANDSYKPHFNVGAEQRGVERRHPLVWVGKLWWSNHDVTVRLRNISKTGAMIAMDQDMGLASGDAVELRLHESEPVCARVCWSAGDQLGLEFAEDFDVSRLIAIACAELAADDADEDRGGAEEECVPDVTPEGDGDDFTSLRIRLASKGDSSPKPGRMYSRQSLDEIYDTLHPARPSAPDTTGEDDATG